MTERLWIRLVACSIFYSGESGMLPWQQRRFGLTFLLAQCFEVKDLESTPSLLPSQQSGFWIIDLATDSGLLTCCQVNNPDSRLLTWQQRGCGSGLSPAQSVPASDSQSPSVSMAAPLITNKQQIHIP